MRGTGRAGSGISLTIPVWIVFVLSGLLIAVGVLAVAALRTAGEAHRLSGFALAGNSLPQRPPAPAPRTVTRRWATTMPRNPTPLLKHGFAPANLRELRLEFTNPHRSQVVKVVAVRYSAGRRDRAAVCRATLRPLTSEHCEFSAGGPGVTGEPAPVLASADGVLAVTAYGIWRHSQGSAEDDTIASVQVTRTQ